MRAIMKKPGQAPEIIDIPNELKALQEAVGGWIEVVTIAEDACIICNEEGRLMGLPDNCRILGVPFVGNVLICGVAGEEFADLSEEAAAFLRGVFGGSER